MVNNNCMSKVVVSIRSVRRAGLSSCECESSTSKQCQWAIVNLWLKLVWARWPSWVCWSGQDDRVKMLLLR